MKVGSKSGRYMQTGRGISIRSNRVISPTQDIRELSKKAGFHWSPKQKVWGKNIDKVDYSATQLQQEEWYMKARSIIVPLILPLSIS